VIGCGVSAAYLNVSSKYEEQAKNVQAVEAMQIQSQYVSTAADASWEKRCASVTYFMGNYYRYLQEGDRKHLLSIVEDSDAFYSEEELNKIVSYVEEYRNLEYKMEKADEEDAVIVFAFFEMKLYDIDTVIPGVSQFYVRQKGESFLIYNNEEHLSEEAVKTMKATLCLDDVKALIEQTDEKYQKAVDSDDLLKEYLEDDK
jgi:hypothetical protein